MLPGGGTWTAPEGPRHLRLPDRPTPNLNRLFPRLSIRVKLAIAFAVVSLGPLAAVSWLGTRETVARIESTAVSTLRFDLELAERETARALDAATSHVEYLATRQLAEVVLTDASERRLREIERVSTTLIETEPTLRQVKVIDADGVYRMILRADGRARALEGEDGGQFYAWSAAGIAPGEHTYLPVEVAAEQGPARTDLVRAVAIIVPVHDPDGTLRGVVVGEAVAATLFRPLERASAGFDGVTGVVDDRGLVLFHSSLERTSTTPLAAQRRIAIADDVTPAHVSVVTSGEIGSARTADDRLVSFRPLALGASGAPRLTLYRVIPLGSLTAQGRSFLLSVIASAPVVVLLVLLLAVLAADQFTRPILRVREAAWRLARGEPVGTLGVDTRDEIADLAKDFHEVSRQVDADRRQREALMAERTELLERTRTELGELLAHSADAIVSVDAQRRVRSWNGGAAALLGWEAAEAIGRDVDELLFAAPADAPSRRERTATLRRAGALVDAADEVVAHDGERIPVGITETVIRGAAGEELGATLIVRDRRERERLERHLRRSERLSAMSVMAAGLAHELNNPLAILGNRIECMQRDATRGDAPAPLQKDLAVLGEHVTRISGLTRSLLAFARDDERGVELVAPDALAATITRLLRQTFVMRGLTLACDPAEAVPSFEGNAKAIETVLVNLLLNAADATPEGGTVRLAVHVTDAGGIAFEVTDTGPGIPVEHRERVFEPFFTTKGAGRGTGLGLAVCRSVVDRHGGTIRVDDAPGGGARFVVHLPLRPAGEPWMRHAS